MSARIFDIEDGAIKINENCYLIPELNALMTKYDNPVPALAYVYYMVAPDSPYANYEEAERQEVISGDVGGDFGFEDEEIEAAMEKVKKMMYTPTQRVVDAARRNLDEISRFLMQETATAGRDGSLDSMIRLQNGLPKIVEGLKKLEKIRDEELRTKLRGSAQTGMY